MAVAGLFGLLLVGGGASPAMAWDVWGDGPFNANGDTVNKFIASFNCEGRARFCINGAVNSGNTKNAENVWINGNPSSSGSPTNSSGANNSGSTANGSQSGSGNKQQHLGQGSSLHL
ncbi:MULTISPECIES: hypothetical protein [Streptomyces]|uniref:Uncharacterized protein n=1 Tax=Streptomyces yunnanensis TaxID=156453 RepID=A0ABY8ADB8_9ACTN|nr:MULTISPECIES: hypothetical protein [Streptomyces]AJC57390.1 exported protein of unknown function [Streptomyces sp. 769]WEB41696.1 hypothetical protein MOV08_22105 [Streptomyces yunnanensis]